jgi:hypothetical protein
MQIELRRLFTITDEKLLEDGRGDGGPPLRRVAAVAIIRNPVIGQGFVADLQPMIAASESLGARLAELGVAAMGGLPVESYGKGGIAGLAGEQEHINAMLTTTFAEPLRRAVGGGAAWISSFTKRGAPGTTVDIPLAHKDALYVRSHYDGMTVAVPDAPMPDELLLAVVLANRGRINARVGGLKASDIQGKDGLR